MASESWQCGGCKKWYPPSKEECSCAVEEESIGKQLDKPYIPPYQPYPYIEPWLRPYIGDPQPLSPPIRYFGDWTGKYPNSSGLKFTLGDNTAAAQPLFKWETFN